MKFKAVNVTFQLAPDATFEQAHAIEVLVREFAARQNLKGTIALDTMDDLSPVPTSPKSA